MMLFSDRLIKIMEEGLSCGCVKTDNTAIITGPHTSFFNCEGQKEVRVHWSHTPCFNMSMTDMLGKYCTQC